MDWPVFLRLLGVLRVVMPLVPADLLGSDLELL